jgi:hypothetical protein
LFQAAEVITNTCRVLRYSAWSPSPDEKEPDIGFTDSRFRRRLSMISRMTIRVLHDLAPPAETKIYFVSFRGESERQFSINKMLFEEGDLLPAAFSLSVFNAPPALASMALNLNAGYSAVYPGENKFSSALLGAAASLSAASLMAAAQQKKSAFLALVYADEALIDEYKALEKEPIPAQAFAALLSAKAGPSGIPLPFRESPEAFLQALAEGLGPAKDSNSAEAGGSAG